MHKNFRKYNLLPKFLFAFACLIALSFSFASPTKAAYTCTGGGDHGGLAWDPATDCPGGIAGVHTNVGALTINSGETATILAYNGTTYGTVDINATSIDVEGTLTAAGKGYLAGSGPGAGGTVSNNCAGGGAHGGNGGSAASAGGTAYDSFTAPTQMGSGGANGGNTGGSGGGLIQLTSTGTITIGSAGSINANGGNGSGGWGGGGAGGSIYITGDSLTGSGLISANGGNAGGSCAGAGGGGRIAIYYSGSNSYSGSGTVTAAATGTTAENGTSILVDSTNNDLYLNANQVWNTNPSFEGGIGSYHNITIGNNATVHIKGYYTTNTNGVGINFVATNNFTVNSGATLESNSGGYAGGANTGGNGAGPGGGVGVTGSNNIGAGGAAYGGNGGTAASAGGTAYGSYTAPVDLGSGGGGIRGFGNGVVGGAGGGAIKITATGTLNINGSISVNGANGAGGDGDSGAGSGGSVYIITGGISGSGSISANGGSGVSSPISGAGAGGRIAIYYSGTDSYSGTLAATVNSGSTGDAAENGTSILVDSTNNDLYLNTSETINSNPSFEGGLDSVNYHNITVQGNSTIKIKGYYTTNTNGVGIVFNATNNFTVTSGSTVTGNGTGYAGGAADTVGAGSGGGVDVGGSNNIGGGGGAYGGNGGQGNGSATIATEYGSYTAPVDLGSGGGGSMGITGGTGGAAIKINASGTFSINGSITMNGANGAGGNGGSGAGAGGSVYIIAGNISGAGNISANGGNGSNGCCTYLGGSGSGGRIAIYYSGSNSYSGILSASVNSGTTPGGSTLNNGENGTSILVDSTNNDLYLNTSVTINPNPSYEGSISTANYHNITVQGNATIKIKGYYTTNTNGVGIVFNTTNNFTLASGSELYMDGQGYAGGVSNGGTGAGPGGGGGVNANNNIGGSGGGYGGAGAVGNGGAAAGSTYGSSTAPVDLGSGGGGDQGQAGGAGGGAVKISANGIATINGTISANGTTAGTGTAGGSGGSIYITAGTFAGSGTLSAQGGNGYNSTYINSGGGGGGRIAVNYTTANTFTGTTNVQTSTIGGGYVATDGTIVITGQGVPVLTSINQYQSDCSTSISSGATLTGALAVCFKGLGTDALSPEEIALQIEIEPNGTAFTNVPTFTGAYSVYSGISTTVKAIYSGLSYNSSYHWQARLIDSDGYTTSWSIPGGNPDFVTQISPNTRTASATIDSDTDFNNGTYSSAGITGSGTSATLNISPVSSTYSGYKFYKPITIDNTGNSNTLTNFQVELTLNTSSLIQAGKMRDDCADLRFTDSDGQTSIPYYIESGCGSNTNTIIWIKVPSISASSTKTIYMYYGNPLATSTSSSSNTFDFYDGFSGSSLDSTKWSATGAYTVSNGVLSITTGSVYTKSTVFSEPNEMVEANIGWSTLPNNGNQSGLSISNSQGITGGNGNGTQNILYMDDTTQNGYVKGWANTTGTGFNAANGTGQFTTAQSRYNIIGDNISSTNITFYNARTQTNTYAYTWSNPAYIMLGSYEGSDAGTLAIPTTNIDWVLARKTTTVTPVLTLGSETAITPQTGTWQSSTSTSVLQLYKIASWGDGSNSSIAFSASDSSTNANDKVTYYIRTANTAGDLSSASYINIGSSYGGTIFTKTASELTSLGVALQPYAQIEASLTSYDALSPSIDNMNIYYTPTTPTNNVTVDTDTDFNKGTYTNTILHGTGTSTNVQVNIPNIQSEAYETPITINNNSNSNTLTNYQVSFTLDTATLITAGKMRSDCGDLRFLDSDLSTQITNYWIENCNNSSTKIWVTIPSIPASSSKTIYAYYGNPSLASLSSATNTFIKTISNVQLAYRMDDASGNVTDYSGNSDTGIATGTTSVSSQFGNARSFNGSSDTINVGNGSNVNPTGDFSFDFWVNPGSSQVQYADIFSKHSTGTKGWALEQNSTATNSYYFSWANGTTNSCSAASYLTLTANTWQHVAIVYTNSNTTVTYYKNGVQVASCTGSAGFANSTDNLYLSHWSSGGGRYWSGQLDEFHMYNKALSLAEVTALYNNYGYVTTNSSNTEYVREYSFPEPTASTGSESSISTETWESGTGANTLSVSQNGGWGDGINSDSIAFFMNGTNLSTNQNIELEIRTASTSAALSSASYTNLGTVSEGNSLILTKGDFDSLGVTPNTYMQVKALFNESVAPSPILDRMVIYYNPKNLPNSPTSLSQSRNDGNTAIANGSWTQDGISNNIVLSFLMSSANATDTLTPEVEVEPSGSSFTGTANYTGSAVTYNGTAVTGKVTLTGLSNCTSYKWQAFVNNSIGSSAPVVFNATSPNFSVSNTAPTSGAIYDGNTNGVENTNTTDIKTINANWTGFTDSCSGLQANPYQIAIGTTKEGTDILGYTQTGITLNSPYNTFSNNALSLMTGKTYYVSVKATNNAGLSATVTSTGQSVIPFLSFSIDTSNVNLGEWNTADSFTTFASNILSVLSNAYNGYNVYGAMTSPLTNTHSPADTIPAFSGGTYQNPGTWNTGMYGFGYTTSSTINGLDPFTGSTKFAPFSLTNPGDIVAQNLTNITGSNYTATPDSYTLKYKTSVSPSQASGTYSSSIGYTVIPSF